MTATAPAHHPADLRVPDATPGRPLVDHVVDLAVVGAGVVGLAHAAEALWRGLDVVVVERDARAVGASVRNFGHACITAQAGDLLDLALASRRGWLRAAAEAGFWAGETGGLAVARTVPEAEVLRTLAVERGEQVELLRPAEVAAALGTDPAPEVVAGARLRDDLRVDPRVTIGRLAAWVEAHPRGTVLGRTAATALEPAAGDQPAVLHTNRGTLRARRVVVCVGHDVDHLAPALADAHGVRRCALVMQAATGPASAAPVAPAVLSGTSLLRYDAFAAQPAAADVAVDLAARDPELLAVDANLMATQRPDGTWLVGDSHEHALTPEPFVEAATSTLLLARAARLLGRELRPTQTWQGVYASSARGPLLARELAPGTSVVTVTSGIGMTLSFGLAAASFDSDFASAPVPA